MKEYDVYVPLNYNDGTPVEIQKIFSIQEQLLKTFGGLTYFPQRNEGFWRVGEVTYRDEIVIFRVISAEEETARVYFRTLKEKLKRELAQEEILIVEKEARII